MIQIPKNCISSRIYLIDLPTGSWSQSRKYTMCRGVSNANEWGSKTQWEHCRRKMLASKKETNRTVWIDDVFWSNTGVSCKHLHCISLTQTWKVFLGPNILAVFTYHQEKTGGPEISAQMIMEKSKHRKQLVGQTNSRTSCPLVGKQFWLKQNLHEL